MLQGIFWKAFILALLSSPVFRLQNRVSGILIYFAWEAKDFYQSSLGNEVDFKDIMNVFPTIRISKKLRHGFVDERALISPLISSCHWKTLVPFCLQKKSSENAFLTLKVSYHKIVQKNKLCHPKQR